MAPSPMIPGCQLPGAGPQGGQRGLSNPSAALGLGGGRHSSGLFTPSPVMEHPACDRCMNWEPRPLRSAGHQRAHPPGFLWGSSPAAGARGRGLPEEAEEDELVGASSDDSEVGVSHGLVTTKLDVVMAPRLNVEIRGRVLNSFVNRGCAGVGCPSRSAASPTGLPLPAPDPRCPPGGRRRRSRPRGDSGLGRDQQERERRRGDERSSAAFSEPAAQRSC